MSRPIEPKDVVRIKTKNGDRTGVVTHVDGESVTVFITGSYNKEINFGICFNIKELKRIGRTK